MKRLPPIALTLAVLAALVWAFTANRKEAAREAKGEQPISAPARVSVLNGAPVITVDAETRRRSGIAVATLAQADFRPQVRAYAAVLDPSHLTDLRNAYVGANAQLQTVRARLAASETAFDRAKELYQSERNVSLAQLQSAEAAFRADQASFAAAESQVHSIAATAQQEWGPVLGRSLIEGGPLIARLIERRDFLLQVTLPSGVAMPHPPARATIETSGDGRAPVDLVSPAARTDPKIQGSSFFYTVPAHSGVLPGMNVLAYLPAAQAVAGAKVPPEAIVWWQDRAWVYRRTGPDTFTRVQIPTELPAPEGGYIVRDLPKDSEIVTRGAQLLLSEEFRAQIQVED